MKFIFDHNNINVLNLEKSVSFYKEALGLSVSREINASDGSFKIVFLSDAAGAHALELTWMRDRAQPYNLGDNEFHLAVRTSNKADAHKLHTKMGCICYENKDMGLYFISDPDGYWIEICDARADMSAVKTLLNRRSVREFTSEPVSEVLVEGILRAAMQAPSAGNQQPWEFIVVRDKKILSAVPSYHPYAHMVPEADVAILVCGDIEREKHKGFWVQDCSAATQNMLIAIQALGLGGVWLGIYPNESRVENMRSLFEIPATSIVPFALIPIGFAKNERSHFQSRYNESKIRMNKWK